MADSSKAESSNNKSGTEWTVRSRYETTDGDRVTLLYAPEGGRFAVFYSYEWTHTPQLIEYTSRLDAHRAYVVSLQNATRNGAILQAEG